MRDIDIRKYCWANRCLPIASWKVLRNLSAGAVTNIDVRVQECNITHNADATQSAMYTMATQLRGWHVRSVATF